MNNYFNEAIKTIQEWVKIRSLKDSPKPGKPFGDEVYKMLQVALNDGKKLGFSTIDYDGYIGEINWGEGNDEDGFTILCHLDVVPEGDVSTWKVPPYSAEIVDGRLYGRGVLDDKGAAVLCLYALKELKDEGYIPRRKIKLVLGCDEESGWGCIDHYLKVAKFSREGISPDADFPIIYSEKGILHFTYKLKKPSNIEYIQGGERGNVVPDLAKMKIKELNENGQNEIDRLGLKIQNGEIISTGRAAHGSTPQKGDNAIKKLFEVLVANGDLDKDILNNLFNDGKKLSEIEDETGILTFSPNVIRNDNDYMYIQVDVRYPSTKEKEYIVSRLEEIGEMEINSFSKPLYVNKEDKLVKILLSAYEKATGDKSGPIAIGGGTYARVLEKGISFGPNFGEYECHIANENMKIEDLEKAYYIYKESLKELTM